MEFRKNISRDTRGIGEISLQQICTAAGMPSAFKYKDVFRKGFPEHEACDWFRRKHPPMPAARWAKIYAPFDALKGFDEEISSKEVIYTDRIQLDNSRREELGRRLSLLRSRTMRNRRTMQNGISVTIESFVPCADPDHFACDLQLGRYQTHTGTVQCVDETREIITLQTDSGRLNIYFEDILSIESLQEDLSGEQTKPGR